MFANSFVGTLWYWWQQSYVFSLLRRIYRWFRNAWQFCLLRRMLLHVSRIETLYEQSAFAAGMQSLLERLSSLLARIIRWFTRINVGSVNERLWRRIFGTSMIVRFESLFGLFVMAMFLCPHYRWNNFYALIGAMIFFFMYLCVCGLHDRKPLNPSVVGFPMLLFAVACLLGLVSTMSRSRYELDAIRILLLFDAGFLLCYVSAAVVWNRRNLMTLLGFIYFAVFLTAAYAFLQRIIGVAVSASFTDVSVNQGVPGRVYSTLDNPNNYAEFLAMATPLAAVWAVSVKGKYKSIPLSPILVFGLGLPFLAMIMTYSRSGWISIAIAFMILIYYGDKRWLPLLMLVGVIAIPFLPSSIITRLSSMVGGNDSSSKFRIYIWRGILALLEDYWLTGIGLGPLTFELVYAKYARPQAKVGVPHSHMLWAEIMVETGIFGLLVCLWMFLGIVRRTAIGAAQSAPGIRRLTLCACLGAIIGISLTFLVEYVWFYPRDMFAFFIVCGIALGLLRAPEKSFECIEAEAWK